MARVKAPWATAAATEVQNTLHGRFRDTIYATAEDKYLYEPIVIANNTLHACVWQ